MSRKKDYYEFTSYKDIQIEKNVEETQKNGKENINITEETVIYPEIKNIDFNKIKKITIIVIAVITGILIIISKNIQSNIETMQTASYEIVQEPIEDKEEPPKKEEPKKKLPQLTEIGKQNMENIYHTEEKRAFLTFDDGPSNVTQQILDTLKSEGIKATFFVLGSNVEVFPETMQRIYNEGHYIANHGYTHKYSSIYSSPQAVLDEFNRCNEAVQKILGIPEYNSYLFRFPGGIPGGKYAELKQEAKQLLEENNILSIDWNALTGDAESQHPEAEKLMEKLKQTTEGKNSVVILMHDAQAKKVTADMLPDIISYLREQGYEFKTFYDIIQ